jgi:hypothetical protein
VTRRDSKAQGAGQQAEGWFERAAFSFQRALVGFCVETLDAKTTPDFRYVPLPYFDVPLFTAEIQPKVGG